MIEPPRVVESEAQEAAVLHVTTPKDRIQEAMDPGIQEVFGVVMAQGIGPAGPLFSHHLRMDPDVFDFEIGVPVSAPVRPEGRVRPGTLPAAKVARTVYQGSYDGLGEAWGELIAWVGAEGLAQGAEFWEVYLAGPESSDDAAQWRTELNCQLAR